MSPRRSREPARICRPVLVLICLLVTTSPATARTVTSLALDGAGHVVVANNPQLNSTHAISIEAWVRPTSFAGFPTIYGKSFSAGQWLGFSTAGFLRFYPRGSGTFLDGTTAVTPGIWTHVAVTYDAATGRRVYYVNGHVDLDFIEAASPIPISAADLGIGAEADGSFAFSGQIAELRLWSRVRSQTEIRDDLWKHLGSLSDPELRAVWPLDGAATDVRGFSDGSLVGTASFGALPAPPTGSEPARITRLAGAPSVDGLCDDSVYGAAQELPIWYDGDSWGGPDPEFVKVGATASDLYVCLGPRPVPPSGEMEVLIDGMADGGLFTDGDDRLFRADQDGTVEAFEGSSGWTLIAVPGFTAVHGGPTEFDHSYEFQIPRSVITSADGRFGLRLRDRHELSDTFLAPFGWPDNTNSVSPDGYVEALIDDSTQFSDAQDPSVDFVRISPAEPRILDTVTVSTNTRDDVDMDLPHSRGRFDQATFMRRS